MNTSFINPAVTFYGNYKNPIREVRKSLFTELDIISSDFGIEARKILNEKLESNQGKPLFGELFPWIIKDLINADADTTHQISVGWLAIYLYTLFLDDYVDNPKPISPKKFMTGAVLAKSGLLKISHFTSNTPYEQYIDKAFSFSLHNQNLDTQFQKETTTGDSKVKYSEGKNYVLLSCAGALASQNSKYGEFITQFSQTLLLTIQYLDDVSDFKEDFKAGNMTVLLNEAFNKNPEFKIKLKTITNKKLLEELIVTGALQRVIDKIQVLLNQSIILIRENKLDKQSQKSSVELFNSLQTYVSSFNKFLKNNSKQFKNLSQEKQNVILDRAEKYITIIAQSS